MKVVAAHKTIENLLGNSRSRRVLTCSIVFLLLSRAPQTPALAAQNRAPGPAQSPPSTRPTVINAKAREVLGKCSQALGGDAFLRFKVLTTRGRTFAVEDEQTTGLAPFESVVVYPDKRRFSYGKKKPVVLINDGDQEWEVDQYGVTDQTPEQIRRWKTTNRYSLENLLRLRIHEPGTLVQEGGVDFVNNVPTQVLEIVDAQQTQIKLFLNRNTFLPVQISYTVSNPQTGERDEFADVYADYQPVQGVQTPMHISRFLNGERVGEIFRNSAQYDQSYPPDYFQPEAVKDRC